MMTAFPELSTPRLHLRAVTEADEPSYRALLHLPEVTRFSNIADAPDQAMTTEIVRNMAGLFSAGTGCAWIIDDAASGGFVGRSASTISSSRGAAAGWATRRIRASGAAA